MHNERRLSHVLLLREWALREASATAAAWSLRAWQRSEGGKPDSSWSEETALLLGSSNRGSGIVGPKRIVGRFGTIHLSLDFVSLGP